MERLYQAWTPTGYEWSPGVLSADPELPSLLASAIWLHGPSGLPFFEAYTPASALLLVSKPFVDSMTTYSALPSAEYAMSEGPTSLGLIAPEGLDFVQVSPWSREM